MTRNISGNAKVKKADAGLRQKALFVNRSWRRTAFTPSAPPRP